MSLDLHGTVALVTGIASPAGAAIAADLARLGASVAIVDRDRGALDDLAGDIERAGGHVLTVAADLADPDSARHAVGWVVSRCERLDVVIDVGGADVSGGVWQAGRQHLIMAAWDSPCGLAGLITVGGPSPVGPDERLALAAAKVRVRSIAVGESVVDALAGVPVGRVA